MSRRGLVVATMSYVLVACGTGAAEGRPAITQLPEVTTSVTETSAGIGDSELAETDGSGGLSAAPVATPLTLPAEAATTVARSTTTTVAPATTTTTSTTTTTTTTSKTTSTTLAPLAGAATVCDAVAVVGDSTAVGLDGSTGVIDDTDGVVTKLREIGVADVRQDVSGGRSIVETLPGQANGVDAISALQSTGFDGCWVVLLGTNDAANISAGSNADATTRVQRVLDALAGERTLWINASTALDSGHWARGNMLQWNADLAALLAGADNVALADWDAVASANDWFTSDGIHPNADGLRARARFVADNLRVFFPA